MRQLEDRLVPSSFKASTVKQLIADINAANRAGGTNSITLVAGKTFDLTAVNNTTDGATGLPVIAAKDNLTIVGNGDTIERSTASGTPAFRLFDVASGALLTLENLTLQGGLASGSGVSAEGGGIYNQGTLDLSGVTVQNNTAQGGLGFTPFPRGGWGIQPPANGGPGGSGYGGGIYVAAGSVTLQSDTFSGNTALGGHGGAGIYGGAGGVGGNGLGGGMYAAGGTVTMLGDTVTGNAATGGAGGKGGFEGRSTAASGTGEGGGLYLDSAAAVSLDSFTVANVTNNTASTSNNDIYGSYTVSP